ncbi:unannotated protein [freshwater metagenome]|jgi:hypothetical protein|uniref:Unannotated protein n=1 Tax=freshwater metagenome TaxID=449393 RepID=A0A6J7JEW1_9ZZZZ|nr:hypothetical protein [Actinomycetota bacterium]
MIINSPIHPVRIRCSDQGAASLAWDAANQGLPIVLLADGNPVIAGRLAAELTAARARVVVMVGSPDDPAVQAVVDQLAKELFGHDI